MLPHKAVFSIPHHPQNKSRWKQWEERSSPLCWCYTKIPWHNVRTAQKMAIPAKTKNSETQDPENALPPEHPCGHTPGKRKNFAEAHQNYRQTCPMTQSGVGVVTVVKLYTMNAVQPLHDRRTGRAGQGKKHPRSWAGPQMYHEGKECQGKVWVVSYFGAMVRIFTLDVVQVWS